MQNPLPSSLNRKGPHLSAGSWWLASLCGAIGTLVVLPGIFSLINVHHAQCPSSSFKDGLLYAGLGLASGIVIGAISLVILLVSILGRCNVLTYTDGYTLPPIWRKVYTAMISMSSAGLLISAALCLDSAERYFCATPTNIVIRSGFFSAPRLLTWNDVQAIYAWCWSAKPRYGSQYLGASVKLVFGNGDEVPLLLADRGQILMQDYKLIKGALEGKNYRYYVNSTVTPAMCPDGMYTLLWNWQN